MSYDWRDSLNTVLTTNVRDWGLDKADAWIYAIIVGWDEPALREVAKHHKWSEATTERLRQLRRAYVERR